MILDFSGYELEIVYSLDELSSCSAVCHYLAILLLTRKKAIPSELSEDYMVYSR